MGHQAPPNPFINLNDDDRTVRFSHRAPHKGGRPQSWVRSLFIRKYKNPDADNKNKLNNVEYNVCSMAGCGE